MLKIIQDKGVKLKQRTLWLFAVILTTMSVAVAQIPADNPVALVNALGLPAPFLWSWASIWFFSGVGGISSMFFKIEAVDKNFRYLVIAKPFLGTFGAVAMCLLLATTAEPPTPALSAYAFIASLLSAPLLQGLLTVASLPKNQAGLFNAVNPFKFKIVVDNTQPTQSSPTNAGDKSDKGDTP